MGEKNFEIKHYKLPNDVNLNDMVDFEYFDKAIRENAMHAYDAMRYAVEDIGVTRTKYNQCYAEKKAREIERVIFSDQMTIVIWGDGTKTMVKCDEEVFDYEKGLAMAIAKKFLGTNKSKSNYFEVFKKWIPGHPLNEELTMSFSFDTAKVPNIGEQLCKALGLGLWPNKKIKDLPEEAE